MIGLILNRCFNQHVMPVEDKFPEENFRVNREMRDAKLDQNLQMFLQNRKKLRKSGY